MPKALRIRDPAYAFKGEREYAVKLMYGKAITQTDKNEQKTPSKYMILFV